MRSLVFLICLAAVLAFAGGASADGWVDLYSDAGTQFLPTGTANPGTPFPPGSFPQIVAYHADGGTQPSDSGNESGLTDVFVGGGNREVRLAFDGATTPGELAQTFVDEFFDSLAFTNGAATGSTLVVNYGLRPDWTDIDGVADTDVALNLDLSVDVAFFVRVDFMDQAADVSFEIVSDVDGTPVTGTQTLAMPILTAGPPEYVFAPFTGFSNYGSLDFSDIDSISLIVISPEGLDLEISALGYYSPEPGSMALLGIGLAALARRRRRRR